MTRSSTATRANGRWTASSLVLAFSLLGPAVAGTFAGQVDSGFGDRDRRVQEDRRIEAAKDKVERAEARLAAASASMRLDLSPRLRTRLWWTRVDEPTAAIGRKAGTRADSLASTTFAELLSSKSPAADRLRAGATTIGATGRLLRDQLETTSSGDRLKRLAAYQREIGDAVDRTSEIDGPTLLVLSAATLAADPGDTNRALELYRRAGTLPEGIDAIEYEFLGTLIEGEAGGGVAPAARIRATDRMLSRPRAAADRLLLGAIQLQARLEAGESPTAAIDATRRATIPARGLSATDRVLLLRGVANLAATSVPDTPIANLPPLAALGRLAPRVAAADPASWRDAEVQALVARAGTSTVPEVRAEILLDTAALAMRAGDVTTAREVLLEMIETLPTHPKAMTAGDLGVRLAMASGDDAIIREASSRTLRALPDHPGRDEWLLDRANRAITRGDVDEARAAWQAIPTNADASIEARVRLVEVDLDAVIGRTDDAAVERTLERLAEIDPRLSAERDAPLRIEVDVMKIRLLTRLDRTSEAANIAAGYGDLDGVPEALQVRLVSASAPALQLTGRGEEAEAMLAALERARPGASNAIAARMLNGIFDSMIDAIDRDDREAARSKASTALASTTIDVDFLASSAERDPNGLVGTAWLLAVDGRTADAMRLAEAILASRPSTTEALYLRAVILGSRLQGRGGARIAPSIEDAGRAIKDLRRIIAGSPRGSSWWWRAQLEQMEILVSLGRDLDGIENRIERIRKEFPNLGGPAFKRRTNALSPAITEARRRSR
ncbi:MAG: hypothetical protein GY895_21600 [Phycisphaera sp.]|nr:hypothetical protein [Phycisphaera sp.]